MNKPLVDTTLGDPKAELRAALLSTLAGQKLWRTYEAKGCLGDLQTFRCEILAHVPNYSTLSTDLEEWPLLTKAQLKETPTPFLSTAFLRDELVQITTTGTTGTPLTVFFDQGAWFRTNFDCFRLMAQKLKQNSETYQTGKIGVLGVTLKPGVDSYTTILPSLSRCLYHLLASDRLDGDPRSIIDSLSESSIGILHAKPTALLDLMHREMDATGASETVLSIKAIVVSGEPLYADDRVTLTRWFNAQVYNMYTSTEGGIMAMECAEPGCQSLHVWQENVTLEVLSPSGLGNEGIGELVVTNHVNQAMPFVRYRTGDFAELRVGACTCGTVGPYIRCLYGRSLKSIRLNGNTYFTDDIERALLSTGIDDFQLIADDTGTFDLYWQKHRCSTKQVTQFVQSIHQAMAPFLPSSSELALQKRDALVPAGGKKMRFVQSSQTTDTDIPKIEAKNKDN